MISSLINTRCIGALVLGLNVVTAITRADAEISVAERAALIQGICTKLDAEYVFPEVGKQMSDAIRNRSERREYDSISIGQLLADKLTADLRDISHDKHLEVIYAAEGARDEPEEPSTEEIKSWRETDARFNFGFDKVERMEGNVGYVEFRVFDVPSLAAETVNAAMTFVANSVGPIWSQI
jgi:hypothetical protein